MIDTERNRIVTPREATLCTFYRLYDGLESKDAEREREREIEREYMPAG